MRAAKSTAIEGYHFHKSWGESDRFQRGNRGEENELTLEHFIPEGVNGKTGHWTITVAFDDENLIVGGSNGSEEEK